MSVIMEQNTYLHFINGEWVKSQSGDMVKVENPADVNDIVGYVQNSTAEDVERAVAAANEAKTAWRKLTGRRARPILIQNSGYHGAALGGNRHLCNA